MAILQSHQGKGNIKTASLDKESTCSLGLRARPLRANRKLQLLGCFSIETWGVGMRLRITRFGHVYRSKQSKCPKMPREEMEDLGMVWYPKPCGRALCLGRGWRFRRRDGRDGRMGGLPRAASNISLILVKGSPPKLYVVFAPSSQSCNCRRPYLLVVLAVFVVLLGGSCSLSFLVL